MLKLQKMKGMMMTNEEVKVAVVASLDKINLGDAEHIEAFLTRIGFYESVSDDRLIAYAFLVMAGALDTIRDVQLGKKRIDEYTLENLQAMVDGK